MNNKLSLHLGLIPLSLLAFTAPHFILSTPAQAKPLRSLEMIQNQGGFTGLPRQTFGNSIPRGTINRPAPSFPSPAPFRFQTPAGSGFGPIQRPVQRPVQRENRPEPLLSRPGLNVLPTQTTKPPIKHKDFIHQLPSLSKPGLQQPHPVTINPIPAPLKPIQLPLKPEPPHKPNKPKPPHHHHHHYYHYSYWHPYWYSFWTYPNWYEWQPGGVWYPLRSEVQEARCPNSDNPQADLEIGTLLANLPANAESIMVKGTRYYSACGSYLLASGASYRVVTPPIGAIVSNLPEESVVIYDSSNTPYFYHNGTFFSRSNEGYTIVLPPSGIEVPYLPKGYTSVTIHGDLYYHYGGVTYQMFQNNGKTIYVVAN